MAALLDALGAEEQRLLLQEADEALRRRMGAVILRGRLARLFAESSRRARGRIARAWLAGVVTISLVTIGLDILFNPGLLGPSLAMRGLVIPTLYGALIGVWRRPRPAWIEGLTLPLAVAAMMVTAGLLGPLTRLGSHDYLLCGLFGIATGLVIVPVQLRWTVAAAVVAIGMFLGFGLAGPEPWSRTAGVTLYCACVTYGMIVARHAINSLLQHAFLLRLKSAIQGRQIAAANARLAVQADTDPLTGLLNRRGFDAAAAGLWREPGRGRPVGILLADIDAFKRLNDSAGHAAGDRCLEAVAAAIRASLPEAALVARYGGEEFVALLADPAPGELLRAAEATRAAVAGLDRPHPLAPEGIVTVSIGVAESAGAVDRDALDRLIAEADLALYRAKAEGRNRVSAARPPRPPEAEAA